MAIARCVGRDAQGSATASAAADKRAPETGYEGEIAFDRLPNDREQFYFYCRIGGLYGKGSTGIRSRGFPNLDEVQGGVTLVLNPDGSRNVTTVEY